LCVDLLNISDNGTHFNSKKDLSSWYMFEDNNFDKKIKKPYIGLTDQYKEFPWHEMTYRES